MNWVVRNIHHRSLHASPAQVASLLDGLASRDDRLWPHESWPRMRFDRPLQPGAVGGHGPIRYTVEAHQPGQSVVFKFTGPSGFHGNHRFDVLAQGSGTLLRHNLEMRATGAALVTWPMVFRPLHDALVEDALSKAQAQLGEQPLAVPWSPWVRFLRKVLAPTQRQRFAP